MGKNRVPRRSEVIEAVPASIASEGRMPQGAKNAIFAAFRVRRTNVDAFALRPFDAYRFLRLVLRFFPFISDGFCLMPPHQQLRAGVRFDSYVDSHK
jgi:hypothetical protein